MKNNLILILTTFITFVTHGQEDAVPKTDFTKMYLSVWLEATEHCLDIAKTMPEDLYTYKPTDVSKTFAEQMVHIAAANKLLTQRYVLGMEVKPNTPNANEMSKTEILFLMEDSFAFTTQVIKSIEQDKLDETCVMYHSGNTVSRAFALFYVQDHMANHRAKSNLYLRMNEVEPPEYTW